MLAWFGWSGLAYPHCFINLVALLIVTLALLLLLARKVGDALAHVDKRVEGIARRQVSLAQQLGTGTLLLAGSNVVRLDDGQNLSCCTAKELLL